MGSNAAMSMTIWKSASSTTAANAQFNAITHLRGISGAKGLPEEMRQSRWYCDARSTARASTMLAGRGNGKGHSHLLTT
jgi:hypothetical protein